MNPVSLLQPCNRYAALLPVLLSLVLACANFTVPGVSADGQTYLQIARNIHFGAGLGWQALWAAPLHSILIAVTAWLPGVGDLQLAAGLVSALMGVLLTAAVYYLAREHFTLGAALLAGLITAVFPHFRWIARSTEPEATYTALLILSLALFSTAVRRTSLPFALVSGSCFSLAYMSRSEGFVVMLFTLGITACVACFQHNRAAIFKLIAAVLLFFVIVSLPYLLFLKKNYGAWTISPKATYVLIWMQSRVYHDNNKGEADNDDLWGLADNGRLKWQQPSSFRDLLAYLMSHPAKSVQVYLHNLSLEIPGRIPNNSGMQHYPQVYPVALVMLALYAAFRPWGQGAGIRKAILYSPLLILLLLPVYTEGWWKYLVPYAPLFIIGGAAGLMMLIERLIADTTVARRIFAVCALFIVCWYWYAAIPPRQPAKTSELDKNRSSYSLEAEKAGKWIAATLGPGHNYMVKWSKLIYPLNGLWTAEPVVSDYRRLYNYARQQGAEFLLVEMSASAAAEELAAAPPGLKFVTMYRSPDIDYGVAVYRFTPITES